MKNNQNDRFVSLYNAIISNKHPSHKVDKEEVKPDDKFRKS